jgi:hypothetical protein
LQLRKDGGQLATLTFVLPILPEKQEAWRRFHQELLGIRHSEYEVSRHRLGVTSERASLCQTAQGESAIISIEAEEPALVISKLAASDLPFDRWFRRKVLELYGYDLMAQPAAPATELIFVWSSSQ